MCADSRPLSSKFAIIRRKPGVIAPTIEARPPELANMLIRSPFASSLVTLAGVAALVACFIRFTKAAVGNGSADGSTSFNLTPLFDLPLFGAVVAVFALVLISAGLSNRREGLSIKIAGWLAVMLLTGLIYLVLFQTYACGVWSQSFPQSPTYFEGGGCARDARNTDPYFLHVMHDRASEFKSKHPTATTPRTSVLPDTGWELLYLAFMAALSPMIFMLVATRLSRTRTLFVARVAAWFAAVAAILPFPMAALMAAYAA